MKSTEPYRRKWRFAAAPAPYKGEAPSSWFCRVAHAHRLTIEELVYLQGASASELDLGMKERVLAEISGKSSVTSWPAPDDVVEAMQSVGLMPDWEPRLLAHDWWSYCPACVGEDTGRGTPHIRAVWVHPFAYACLRHGCYLRAWPRDHEVQLADGRTFLLPLGEGRLIQEAASDEELQFAKHLLTPRLQRWEPLAHAVTALADALLTRTGANGIGPVLLREFTDLRAIGGLEGTYRLPRYNLAGQPAHLRLRLLRAVSSIVRHMPDQATDRTSEWLKALVKRRRYLQPRSLVAASADPLFEMMVRLNSTAADQLAERSKAWPADLRSRMGAAVIIGAIANSG